jgi:CelD/BcsL family acetyltransferase involved in cellulose biosynthesis
VAQAVLSQSGYRVVREAGARSPYCRLPGTYEELLASTSRNLRSQLGRRRRALEREGRLVFRTVKRPHDLESNLDSVFWVEGSGWKTARSTAILSDPRTRRFYTELAHAAAAEGWLRLHLLELDGVVIAADYALAFAGGEFLLKTGFNQSYSRRSPGFVLRGAVLRSAIEEGLAFYDFLGGAEPYKLRWASQIRPRVTLRAYHGAAAMPRFAYSARVRPRLKAIHARARRGHGPA